MNAALIWTLSGLTAGGAIALLLWAMLWDRARGRRRCPRCFYDMSWAPDSPDPFPITCPECGRPARTPRALRRTRRRWRVGMCAAIVVAASLAIPLALTGSWLKFVPAPALDFVIESFFQEEAAAAYRGTFPPLASPERGTLGDEWQRYLACWELGRVALEDASTAEADQMPLPGLRLDFFRLSILRRNGQHPSIRMAVPRLAEAACLPGRSYERTQACNDLIEIGPRARAARHRVSSALKTETEDRHSAKLLDTLLSISDDGADTDSLLTLYASGLPHLTRRMVLCIAGGKHASAGAMADPLFMGDLLGLLVDLLNHDDPRLRCAAAVELAQINFGARSVVAALERAASRETDATARDAMQRALESLLESHPHLGHGPAPDP